MQSSIAIIGGGHMASSLIAGLIRSGHNPKKIWVSNPHRGKLNRLHRAFGVRTNLSNEKVAREGKVVLFAVKPQHFEDAAKSVAEALQVLKPLVISIAAGIRTRAIQKWLNLGKGAIVRCMPNTPALIGQGMSVLYANRMVSPSQKRLAESIMQSVGKSYWTKDEALLDGVTAISGGGPAYFFWLMEILEAAAVRFGMSPLLARTVVTQTAFGSAAMAFGTKKEVRDLKEQVISPGGTTAAAFKILESERAGEMIDKAIRAALKRAKELGKQYET